MTGIRSYIGLAICTIALASGPNSLWAQSNPNSLPPTESLPGEPALVPQTLPGNQPAPYPNPPQHNPNQNQPGTPVATQAPADDRDLGPGQQPDNPTGRQEPAVSIEWIGPPQAKVGRPADYTIAVRNACNTVVHQVLVRVRIPAGMTVTATEPKAVAEGNILMWELGSMPSKQDKNIQLRIVPDARGALGCQAWVTFTGSSAMHMKVTEPKLALKASAPEKVMVGDAATFVLTVSNPGDGPAEMVKVHALLSEGLEHPRGRSVDFDIGSLAAGESRSVQLICGTKAGGEQHCEGIAEAEGELKVQDHCSVNVITPRLDIEMAGPKLRYLDRKAVYTIKVINPGDASATNVTINDVVPPGFKFLQASDGGRHDFSTRTVSWYLGEVQPGQSKDVKLEVVAINPGEHHHHVTATAARGIKVDSEIMTRVEGLSAILLEVVDTEDPIEVGADTAYEIRITNTGSKTETDIKLACVIPEKMLFKSAQGPCRFHEQGKEIVFEPLPKLAPRADAIFRINVKAQAPGDVRFKAQITSTNLVEPVIEMESTRIYED
jgi:uncharacterized repeat protein (TIGR01451 family)